MTPPDPTAPLVRILIDGKAYELHQGTHMVHEVKQRASIPEADALAQDINNVVTALDQTGSVSITGNEVFLSFPAKVEVTINGKPHEVRRGDESVSGLKKLAGIAEADQLEQDINGFVTLLDQTGSVKINGGEVFLSFPAIVKITVDGKSFEIGRGKEPVAAIKKVASVPAANQLDQDINGVLTPIDQDGSVLIRGGEIFVSYPATGSSS
jgi:predicted Rdx family selenoprotein